MILNKNEWSEEWPAPERGLDIPQVTRRLESLAQQFAQAKMQVLAAEANLREAQDACAHLMGQIYALQGLAQSRGSGDNGNRGEKGDGG